MNCQSCAASVESLLKQVPGVQEAQVYFANREVRICYEPAQVSFEKLKEALAPAGYELMESLSLQQEKQRAYLATLRWHIFLVGLLALPGMAHAFLSFHLPATYALLTLPVVAWLGYRYFFQPAWHQLKVRQLTMDTLVSVGLVGAISLSIMEISQGRSGHALWAGAEILFFVLLGRYLEEKAHSQASYAVESLSALAVPTARRLRGGRIEEVPTEALSVGDEIEVLPHSVIPVDGQVVAGESWVQEGLITGEPLPAEKRSGSSVWAGTQNLSGTLRVRVEVPVGQTLLAQLVAHLQKAQSSRSHFQRIADRVSAKFVPIVLLIAVGTGLYYGLIQQRPWEWVLERMLSVLLISCPCALGLATPIAVQAAVGKATQARLLLREIAQLERLPQATLWAFDKTGTLTQGKAQVGSETIYDPTSLPEVLALASLSAHPLAQAVAQHLRQKGISPAEAPISFMELPGKGIIGNFSGRRFWMGSPAWVAEKHPALNLPAQTAVAAASEEKVIALFTLADPVRENLRPFIQALQASGKKVVLLTGDASSAAEVVAQKLDIPEVHKGLSPYQKAEWIETQQRKGHTVVFVGDGINDSLALSKAAVGIAVYQSAAMAMGSAGIALLGETSEMLPLLYRLSLRLRQIIIQNLIWAFSYNAIALPAAVGILPQVVLSPGLSALFMSLSSLVVVLNSLRMQKA